MSDSPHPPRKRHVSLQPFSRDHYVGLVQAQRLTKSADAGPAQRRKALSEFVETWAGEISAHFRDEERLLPELVRGEPIERLRREHRALAELSEEARVRASSIEPGPDWVRELGRMLHDHIRWEERELFPLIERSTSRDKLDALADETTRIEQGRPRNATRSPRGGRGRRAED
jgi:hemerythrin-like domain-containing protein